MNRTVLIALLVVTWALGACGDDSHPTTSEPPGDSGADGEAFPVTIATADGELTINERPERIVSLAPVATEMLFAIGAHDQVVAVDDQSNHPLEAPMTDLSGFTPNLEAIAAKDPDLVIAAYDPGDLVDGLDRLRIPTVILAAAEDLDDTFAQLEQLGAATGNLANAVELVAEMQTEIESILAAAPEPETPLTYFHELDPDLYTVTSDTFIGGVYAMVGLENIADAADDGSGYPKVSAEFVLAADPDLIFLADVKCCGQTLDTVRARPGWDTLTAVQRGNVIELDDDIASRWGPRTVDHLRAVVHALEDLQEHDPAR